MKRLLCFLLAALCLVGCDEALLAPARMSIVSVGFRRGFSSDYVLQVGNLSASQGVEVKVHVANGGKAKDGPVLTIPVGAKKDFGVLEMGWNFSVGDRGFVAVESHPTRVYFAVLPDGRYGVFYSQSEISDEELAKRDFEKAARPVK